MQSHCRPHASFEALHTSTIAALNLEVTEYRHRRTGARHLHLAADDDNNAFLVAFLTVPQDSTGVAHILEHTSLCGSERYPVRDPFFMMIRRSLNTFMNAFTSSDWTAYPFASRNVKDFDNLMSIYLDAVFFPRLDPLDFSQEGHRVEFETPADADSPLVYKGVVFNEMKGAMSSPVSAMHQSLQSALFPTTTYHHNSGGDPARIPDLSYEQLKAFHARHYHPSNATFMSYGDLPAEHHQAQFDTLALARFEHEDIDLAVPDEQRYPTPVRVEDTYPVDDDDCAGKTYVMLGWLLGLATDPVRSREAHLLAGVLLGNSASPLRRALETTSLGSAPAPVCGFDDSTREANFVCGVEGSDPEHAEAVEQLVLDVLTDVCEHGVDQAAVESELHQLELSQREVGGDHFPYGLQLMVNALTPAIHGGDPVAMLDIDPALERMRESIRDPDYIPSLCRELLLDNPHRVRLTFTPDPGLNARRHEAERAALDAIKSKLDAEQRKAVIDLAASLEARQLSEDNPELLPRVTLDDVPKELKIPEGSDGETGGMPTTWYPRATNGLVYAQVISELPQFEPELVDVLPVFSDVLTEVGCGSRGYEDMQRWQSAVTGGIGAGASVRGGVEDATATDGYFSLSGKALARNHAPLAELMQVTFSAARFDEHSRIRDLVAQLRAMREARVTNSGHVLAMMAATAGLSPVSALAHVWSGLEGVKRIKALDETLNDTAGLEALTDKLQTLMTALRESPRRLLLIGEASEGANLAGVFDSEWGQLSQAKLTSNFVCPTPAGYQSVGWSANTQVSFNAKAYRAVPQGHADAAALTVLGTFLRNGYLHRAIREQGGAYGGGAGYDSDSASFRFFSYRDPRLDETLADFDASVSWLLDTTHEPRTLEEAVLGVVGGIDRPGSPAGEAAKAYFGSLHGRTPAHRREFRERVLDVSMDDLKRVADTYLHHQQASVAVLSSADRLDRAAVEFDEVHQL